jgi:tetratricopeptide (TPR) repeat protein
VGWGASALLVVCVVVAFAPVVTYGFVNWDDGRNFTENPHYRGLTWDEIRWALTTTWLGVYQPLAWVLLEAEYAAFGLDGRGYHLVSLGLHAANAVLLARLLAALLVLGRAAAGAVVVDADRRAVRVAAWLAAALFAVHPLRVEAVAWASCQPYLPCALFTMLSALAYLHPHAPGFKGGKASRAGWLFATLLWYTAALLSKAAAVGLVAVFVILDVYPLRRLDPARPFGRGAGRVWAEKVPFLVPAALCSVAAVLARPLGWPEVEVPSYGLADRVALAGAAFGFGLVKSLWPSGLSAFYPLPARGAWADPAVLAGVLAVTAVSVLAVAARRRWPALPAAWAGYLALLTPTVNAVWANPCLSADRYTYIPSVPLAALLAAGLLVSGAAGRAGRSRFAVALALALVLTLTAMTWRQVRTWRDSEALWRNVLARGVSIPLVHKNMGWALLEKGRTAEAFAHALEALRFRPDDPVALNNVGAVLLDLGRRDEAEAHFLRAIRLDPDLASARHNFGNILLDRGRVAEAIDQLGRAVSMRPESASMHHDYGDALARQGKLDEAVVEFTTALFLDPGRADSRRQLARVMAQRRDPLKAAVGLTAPPLAPP